MEVSAKNKREIHDFFSFFDNLGMALLVTDPETDEILFANETMNRSYGLAENPVGKTCYEVYGDNPSRKCVPCPATALMKKPDQPVVWERYHEKVKKWFRHTDIFTPWHGGRLIHVQYIVDITREKEEEFSVAFQKEQQELMAAVTKEFAVLKENVYEQIYQAFQKAGKFLKVDRIVLLKMRPNTQEFFVECAWYRKEVYKPESVRRGMPARLNFRQYNRSEKKYIICGDVSQDPQYAVLKDFDITGFLAVPVWTDGRESRLISFETNSNVKPPENNRIHLATVLGDIIGNALVRVADMERVKQARKQARALLDVTPLGCILFNDELKIIDSNQMAARMHTFQRIRNLSKVFLITCRIRSRRAPTADLSCTTNSR